MKKITFLSSNLVAFLFVTFFFVSKGIAQEVKIYELFENNTKFSKVQAVKSTLKTGTTSAKSQNYTEDLNNFYELNYKLKPTIYIENNTIVQVPNNETPIKIKLDDVKSFNVLKANNTLFKTVELIVIDVKNLGELNTSFDISSLQDFSSLKYVFVQCNQFSSSVSQMQKFVLNTGANITVYFMTVNPS